MEPEISQFENIPEQNCSIFADQERLSAFRLRQMNSLAEANKEAIQFSGLQIQIASVLLAFSAVGSLVKDFPIMTSDLVERTFLVSAWVALTLSLFFGLLTSHVKQNFFLNDVQYQTVALRTWRGYLEGEMNRKAALDTLERFSQIVPSISPSWPWIIQTVLLFLGTVGLFVVMVCVVF